MTLEELLNTLCERWWEPFGKTPVNITQWYSAETYCKYFDKRCIHIHREDDIEYDEEDEDIRRPRRTDEFSLRELVSKESGLWQFVCEKDLIKSKWDSNYTYFNIHGTWKAYEHWNYEYRLIESSLCDEDKLEEFLLQNIKVWNE